MKRLWLYYTLILISYLYIILIFVHIYSFPSTFLEYLGLYPITCSLRRLQEQRLELVDQGLAKAAWFIGSENSRNVAHSHNVRELCEKHLDTSYTALKIQICLSIWHFNRWFVRSLPRHRFSSRFPQQLANLNLRTKLEPITSTPRRTCGVLGQHVSVVPSRGLGFSFTPGAGTLHRARAVSWIIEMSKTWKAFAKSDHKHHRNRPWGCLHDVWRNEL